MDECPHMILSRYERMVARRYLLPGKGEGFIFLVAGISLVAVALGVAWLGDVRALTLLDAHAGGPWLSVALSALFMVAMMNAVNFLDNMDGLAGGIACIAALCFMVATILNAQWFIAMALALLAGSLAGFLVWNVSPARIFMGDTGSLALGGALGIMAVLIHQPLVLLIAGGVFVAEAASVMLQVGWFKYTRRKYGEGRRIFRMAPLHHHFQKLGWKESKIVTRFYIAGILCAVVALSTLKIR